MAEGGEDAPARRRSPIRRIAIGVAGLLLIVLLGLWFARKPIATDLIDRTLAAKHVPARYRVAELGVGHQRLTDVVIGDPANPDLVADWIELTSRIGLDGASVTGVRAGHLRALARWRDGRLSFGAIDRLLPAPSGAPFALPAIEIYSEDARLRIDTAAGVVGVKLAGRGRLDGGFRGSVAVVAPRLASGNCVAERASAVLAVRITGKVPTVSGPLRAAAIACGTVRVATARADVDAALSATLDRWRGSVRLSSGAVAAATTAQARVARGTMGFGGTAARTQGTVSLSFDGVAGSGIDAAATTITGRYVLEGGAPTFEGSVHGHGVAYAAADRLRTLATMGRGTPVGPLMVRAGGALRLAARDTDLDAAVRYDGATLTVSQAVMRSVSGARLALSGGSGVVIDRGGWRYADGTLTMAGGGLPGASVVFATDRGGMLSGRATISAYSADDARLALAPVTFARRGGVLRVATRAELTGPIGEEGRIERVRLPLVLVGDARGWRWGAGCVPIAFNAMQVASLRLRGTETTLCPSRGAGPIALASGRLSGGLALGTTMLSGAIGTTPLTLRSAGGDVRLGDRRFALERVDAILGAAARVTRFGFARLDGVLASGGAAGRFAGGGGQIGAVPLLLSDAAGDWRFASGRLSVAGGLTVADAQANAPRFRPLPVRDVTLTLAGGTIDAVGMLAAPVGQRKVADLRLRHVLASGEGHADLTVPGLVFDKALQPDQLTPLTFGVIADVAGTVTGDAHIAWSAAGVTSTGTFATAATDLAAAFGPVTGIATTIHFTDLLALESAPGQVAKIHSINPGIAVNDGTIRYRTLPGARVQVEDGRWPFAGGTLTLRPTLLDFSAPRERRMTFEVRGMDAAKFLDQFDFKNLDATGTFDGVLPMIFDESGGRIAGGHLDVRDGGGGIAYVGDLTQKDLGTWGNIAFQALKSLKYRDLSIDMNGPLAGEMVTQVRFAGVTQGEGAKSNFLVRRLQRLPFVFNVTIRAPFRGLIDTAQSFYDPRRLIERNLPTLLREQEKAGVQPPASAAVPPAKQD